MRRSFATVAAGSALLAGCLAIARDPVVGSAPTIRKWASEPKEECRAGTASLEDTGVTLNAQERELGMLLERDPGQQRERIVFSSVLSRVARARARDMAARNYFDHTDPEGFGANHHATQAGYRLPDFYDRAPAGNSIESIGAGYGSAAEAWEGWMRSPPHRAHLLGLEPFYQQQSEYGIGYAHAPDTKYGHYWSVLIAKPQC
jgi:hypothetical protein